MTDTNSNEPIKLTTTNGHKVVIRAFVPPRMAGETRDVFLEYAKLNPNALKGEIAEESAGNLDFKDGIPATIIGRINEITLRRMVISIDEKTGDEAFDFMMDDIRQVDNREIIEKCNEVSKATSLSPEKKST